MSGDGSRCAWPDHPGFGLTHSECAVATRRLERGGGTGQMLLGVRTDHAVGRAAESETWIRGGAVLACPGCGQDSPRVHSLERAVAWQESHECRGRGHPLRFRVRLDADRPRP